MAKNTAMFVYEVGKNRFAIGPANKRAKYVVAKQGKTFVGIRGQRPILNERYAKIKPSKELRAAFAEVI